MRHFIEFKILKKKFNSLETEKENMESPKTTRIQENWKKFVGNTQKIIKNWESDWKELNQKNIKKRKERKRRIILGEKINKGLIDTFFSNQKKAFDKKLKEGFNDALGELEGLGYPGFSDPRITISTKIRPMDSLDHKSSVQYELMRKGSNKHPLRLPEQYNGLGYQNLISIVFR